MKELLRRLCETDGVSGREKAVRELILNELKKSTVPMTTEIDALGSVIVRLKGKQPAAKTLLLAAHMDEVGLIITKAIDGGFLRFTTVGGISPQVLYGKKVRLENGLTGIIGGKAVHQCSDEEKKTAPAVDQLLIDIGAPDMETAENWVFPGDTAVFNTPFEELADGRLSGKALDNRAGCALLLSLAMKQPLYDVVLAFTVQEEVGLHGAEVVGARVQPDIAVAVDSTTAADMSTNPPEKQVCCVGGGAVVSFMDRRTMYDPALYRQILRLAEERGIKAQIKTVVAGGNDAGALQTAGVGARTAAVCMPCRYLHSPCGVIAESDLHDTLALLTAMTEVLPQ